MVGAGIGLAAVATVEVVGTVAVGATVAAGAGIAVVGVGAGIGATTAIGAELGIAAATTIEVGVSRSSVASVSRPSVTGSRNEITETTVAFDPLPIIPVQTGFQI